MFKNLQMKVYFFCRTHDVVVDFTNFGENYRFNQKNQMFQRVVIPGERPLNREIRHWGEFFQGVKGSQKIQILARGQDHSDTHTISWGEFLLLIEATEQFPNPEVAKKKFFDRPWLQGSTPEEWLMSMTRRPKVVQTATGQQVYIAPRIQDSMTLKQYDFMVDCVNVIEIDEVAPGMGADYVLREFDSGRRGFGRTACVKTRDHDEVFYAHLGGHNWGRFVRGRKAETCQYLSIVLRRRGDSYSLHKAYVGHIGEPFPGDPNERGNQSREYWATHALVDGTIPYRQDSVTKDAPHWFTNGGRQAELRAAGHILPEAEIDRG